MQADDAAIEDVVAWRARADARRLAAFTTPPSFAVKLPSEPLDDRIADHVRVEAVTEARALAEKAAPGRLGEPDRSTLRLLIDPFLDRAGSETARDLAEATAECVPSGGFREPILLEPDPAERRRLQREWERSEEAIASRRLEHRRALDAAARNVGSRSCAELASLVAPESPAATAADAERLAIAPLDAAFAAAAGERRKRFRPILPGSPEPSEAVALAWLADHHATIDRRGIGRRLRVLAQTLGFDPDGGGPVLREADSGTEEPQVLEWLAPTPAAVTGRWPGPAALAGGLEALGRAIRALVARRAHGAGRAASADPAFGTAAGILFRRLVLSERFFEWAQIKGGAGSRDDLRFEETARIRLAWARAEQLGHAEAGPGPSFVESLERAIGRPASPDLLASSWDVDAGGAAGLRGAQLAILVEERLRTRSGHLWFLDQRSPRFLRELWEAEPGETADSVADALGLGRMNALLLFDGYRL